ncbi:MAG: PepSY domain-containing protein [Acidiferrobacterales bacterium]|nr:PepSY domain-containing protein [Acidiferrobacterales bacterium]
MKTLFFIFLLFCSGASYSNDTKEQSEDNSGPRKGDEIWLEEKIAPTTTWIESLVKPLTVWMEQKINAPEQESNDQYDSTDGERDLTLKDSVSDSRISSEPESRLSIKEASASAQQYIDGDVLHVKLLPEVNRYRMKIISNLGEIHVIYIDASSGKLVSDNANNNAQSSKTGQLNKTDSSTADLGADTENQDKRP